MKLFDSSVVLIEYSQEYVDNNNSKRDNMCANSKIKIKNYTPENYTPVIESPLGQFNGSF